MGTTSPYKSPTPVVLDKPLIVRVPFVSGRVVHRAARAHPIDELLADPADDLATGPIVHREQEDHQATGGHSTQGPVPLDEHRACTGSGGRDRGGDAGGATAGDPDVDLVHDPHVTRR